MEKVFSTAYFCAFPFFSSVFTHKKKLFRGCNENGQRIGISTLPFFILRGKLIEIRLIKENDEMMIFAPIGLGVLVGAIIILLTVFF